MRSCTGCGRSLVETTIVRKEYDKYWLKYIKQIELNGNHFRWRREAWQESLWNTFISESPAFFQKIKHASKRSSMSMLTLLTYQLQSNLHLGIFEFIDKCTIGCWSWGRLWHGWQCKERKALLKIQVPVLLGEKLLLDCNESSGCVPEICMNFSKRKLPDH